MDCLRDHCPAGDTIATQFVGHDLPRFATIATYQSSEKALCSRSISASLQVHIYYLPVLVNGAPEIVLFASDLYEDLINVECIAIPSVPTIQPTGVFGSELYTPQSDRLVADCDAALSQ